MKILLVFIIFILVNATYSQNESSEGTISSLTPIPPVTIENKISIFLSELMNYERAFKYSNELKNGNYYILKDSSRYVVYITSKNYIQSTSKIRDIIIDSIELEVSADVIGNNYSPSLKMINAVEFIDFATLDSYRIDPSGFSTVTPQYSNKAFVDKKIVQSRILNQTITRENLFHNGEDNVPFSV